MYQKFTKRKRLPTEAAQWSRKPFKKTGKSELMSKFFCSVMIAILIVSFASCEKDDDRNSLAGTTWSVATVWTETIGSINAGDTGGMRLTFTSATMGVISYWTDRNSTVYEWTVSYYKDGDHWQMMIDDDSFGSFTVSGNTLFWHRTNGTTLSLQKE